MVTKVEGLTTCHVHVHGQVSSLGWGSILTHLPQKVDGLACQQYLQPRHSVHPQCNSHVIVFLHKTFCILCFFLLNDHNDQVVHFVAMVHAGDVCVATIHWTLTWNVVSFTCAHMSMHAIAQRGVWTPKESLHWKLTLGRNPLLHQETEPVPVAWRSDALPREWHPILMYFVCCALSTSVSKMKICWLPQEKPAATITPPSHINS